MQPSRASLSTHFSSFESHNNNWIFGEILWQTNFIDLNQIETHFQRLIRYVSHFMAMPSIYNFCFGSPISNHFSFQCEIATIILFMVLHHSIKMPNILQVVSNSVSRWIQILPANFFLHTCFINISEFKSKELLIAGHSNIHKDKYGQSTL